MSWPAWKAAARPALLQSQHVLRPSVERQLDRLDRHRTTMLVMEEAERRIQEVRTTNILYN